MFSLFKRLQPSSETPSGLLDPKALLALRALAERVAGSGNTNVMLDTGGAGNLSSSALGSGMDYAESRVYQPGDDTRLINWRLSARSQETFVKTFQRDSKPALNLILDRRRSMVFGTQKRLKVTQAVRLAALLAYATQFHQLAFQGWIMDEQGLHRFDNAEAFLEQANQPCLLTSTHSAATMIVALKALAERLKKGSLAYLISDFSDLNKSHQAELLGLKEQGFVQALHLLDKAEITLPKVGELSLRDMRTSQNYLLNTDDARVQSDFTGFSKEYLAQKKALFETLGIAYSAIRTDVDDLQKHLHLPLGLV